jgi:hypothetical protein
VLPLFPAQVDELQEEKHELPNCLEKEVSGYAGW